MIYSISSYDRWLARSFGFETGVWLVNTFKMAICLPREMPRKISCTGILNETTAFLDSICSTRRPTWDSYFARNAWENSRLSQGSKYHAVGFLHLSWASCILFLAKHAYVISCICILCFYCMFHLTKLASVFNCVKTFIHLRLNCFPQSTKKLQAVLFALK